MDLQRNFKKLNTQRFRQILNIFLDKSVSCCSVNGFFHPNGTSKCLFTDKKLEQQSICASSFGMHQFLGNKAKAKALVRQDVFHPPALL
jgi:hypothetical protein